MLKKAVKRYRKSLRFKVIVLYAGINTDVWYYVILNNSILLVEK